MTLTSFFFQTHFINNKFTKTKFHLRLNDVDEIAKIIGTFKTNWF